MTPYAVAGLAALAFLGVGSFATDRLGLRAPLEARFLAGALGVSGFVIVLGIFGAISPATAALPALAVPLGARALLREERPDFSAAGVFAGLVLTALVYIFALSDRSPLGSDALTYHLNLPVQYLARGGTAVAEEILYYRYTQAFETALLPLVAWDETGRAANLLGPAFLAALLAAAGRLAVRTDGPRAAAVAVAAVATASITSMLVVHTKNDLFVSACLLAGVFAWLDAGERPLRAAAWAGFLLGGAVATKASAAVLVVPILAATATRGVRFASCAAAGATVAPAYWLGRNLLEIGAPFPPLLEGGPVFTFGAWAHDLAPRLAELLGAFTAFRLWNIEGPLGILLLLLPAAGLWRAFGDRRLRPIAWAAAVSFVLWSFATWRWWRIGQGQSRFLLPTLHLLLPLGAAVLSERPLARGAAVAAMLFSFSEGVRITYPRFLRSESDGLNTYPVQIAWRAVPASSYTLSVGEPRLFYYRRKASFDGYWAHPRLWRWAHEEGHDPRALRARVRREGFTHLLHNPETTRILLRAGDLPPVRCAADTPTVFALFAALPVVVRHPTDPEVALYALDAPPVSSLP